MNKLDKKKFVLRITPEQYEAIERWAKDEFRSVNGQIEWMLQKCLKENKRSVQKPNGDKLASK